MTLYLYDIKQTLSVWGSGQNVTRSMRVGSSNVQYYYELSELNSPWAFTYMRRILFFLFLWTHSRRFYPPGSLWRFAALGVLLKAGAKFTRVSQTELHQIYMLKILRKVLTCSYLSSLLQSPLPRSSLQVYERGTNVQQFVTRFLLKESANQIQSLLNSVESAVDAIDEQHSSVGWELELVPFINIYVH